MSWSICSASEVNECEICGEPLTDEGALAAFSCDVMVGGVARLRSKEEGYDPPCSLLLGMDWEDEKFFHSHCLYAAVKEARMRSTKLEEV